MTLQKRAQISLRMHGEVKSYTVANGKAFGANFEEQLGCSENETT